MAKRISIGADHAGFPLKQILVDTFTTDGWEMIDRGTFSDESVDYPDFARLVADDVARGEARWGVLICGTGIGMSIAANKVKGIRAALCTNMFHAAMARKHNDANVLTLGARVTHAEDAIGIMSVFLETGFEGDRHKRRVDKIIEIEQNNIGI